VADIVLPAGPFLKKIPSFPLESPLNAIQKVVEVEECKSDWEINFELAKRFNPEIVHWKNVREMFTERISPSGLTFDELRKQVWPSPKGIPRNAPYRSTKKACCVRIKSPDSEPQPAKSSLLTLWNPMVLTPSLFRGTCGKSFADPGIMERVSLIMMTGNVPLSCSTANIARSLLREMILIPLWNPSGNSPSSRYRGWKLGLDRGSAAEQRERQTHSYRSPANGHGPHGWCYLKRKERIISMECGISISTTHPDGISE